MMDFTGSVDGASAGFETMEIDLLRLATTQLADLLDEAVADPDDAAGDPAIARLLPDAYRDDPEAAAEFRRFTADGILEQKVQNAHAVLASLDSAAGGGTTGGSQLVVVSLNSAAVQSWLRTLTDLRLTLAERLRITADGVQHEAGAEAQLLREIFDWLGMVQESLVTALDS